MKPNPKSGQNWSEMADLFFRHLPKSQEENISENLNTQGKISKSRSITLLVHFLKWNLSKIWKLKARSQKILQQCFQKNFLRTPHFFLQKLKFLATSLAPMTQKRCINKPGNGLLWSYQTWAMANLGVNANPNVFWSYHSQCQCQCQCFSWKAFQWQCQCQFFFKCFFNANVNGNVWCFDSMSIAMPMFSPQKKKL